MNVARLLDILAAHLSEGESAVWVGVADVRGSAPRAPGTRMLVTPRGIFGSIGGGHLELKAVELARQMLDDDLAGLMPPARLEHYALGARLGQCCGGRVQLAFDVVTLTDLPAVEHARALTAAGQSWVRVISPGAHGARIMPLTQALTDTHQPELVASLQRLLEGPEEGATLTGLDAPGTHHVVELIRPAELQLTLFGAGHVGRALVETLARLPIRITWIDSRESEFLAQMPHNTRPLLTDDPVAEVRHLPADTAVLITTHSHALDFDLVRAWLDRNDFRFLGLIGSATKRASFAGRLQARGYDAPRVARLTSPVGDRGIVGKEPEVIALSIAAHLLSLRRQGQHRDHADLSTATIR